MTADEIRAHTIEVLARSAYETRATARSSDPDWDHASAARKQQHIWAAGKAVDALAEAGLLPTGAEWGFGCDCRGCDLDQCETTTHAHIARTMRPAESPLWVRYFTDWREITTPQPSQEH
ncbi:hypothetical protein [Nocardia cyriacigeorgica]|uniref:hypothetical protein n=1 Tax=Nocardia cyriacigeorgica TaxID=135487 RepID=UPI002453F3E7|nr:hypothetical protein [Nocardia cyriacigeorgica]